MFASLLGFNGGVDGQEIGLVGNLGHGDDHQIDSVGALADLGQLVTEQCGALRQLLHGGIHACKVGATLFGTVPRLRGHFVDLVHGAQQLLAGGGDLVDGSACFGGSGSVILDHLLLLCAGGLHHRGGGVKRGSGHLDAANERTQVGGHGVDRVEQRSGFVLRDSAHLCTEITGGYLARHCYRRADRRGNGTRHEECRDHHANTQDDREGDDEIALKVQQGEGFARILLHQHSPAVAGQIAPRGKYFNAAAVGHGAISAASARSISGRFLADASGGEVELERTIGVSAGGGGDGDPRCVALRGHDIARFAKSSDISEHAPDLLRAKTSGRNANHASIADDGAGDEHDRLAR